MRNRRRITGFLLFLLAVILCVSASAGTCITAMATSVNPDNLACTAVNARILRYNPGNNTLTLSGVSHFVSRAEADGNSTVHAKGDLTVDGDGALYGARPAPIEGKADLESTAIMRELRAC